MACSSTYISLTPNLLI
uniref:Uncharacterized protein n=1 Tax=Anguilla anguilla TaxID=7936 RepID=A0A0E9PYM0_ANGAN